jgi:hypothetical protein
MTGLEFGPGDEEAMEGIARDHAFGARTLGEPEIALIDRLSGPDGDPGE